MATLTITVPDAEVPRIRTAMGKYLQLKDSEGVIRLATAEEIRLWLVQRVKEAVKEQEYRDQANAIVVADVSAS